MLKQEPAQQGFLIKFQKIFQVRIKVIDFVVQNLINSKIEKKKIILALPKNKKIMNCKNISKENLI